MSNIMAHNAALGREICDIIEKSNYPKWMLSDIFELTPENLYKLKSGKIRPTIFQLIMFMDTARCTLNKLYIKDYENDN